MSGVLKTDQLPYIPGLCNTTQRYTLDYGGSLIKLMYRDKADRSEKAPLKLGIFQSADLEGLVSFVIQNVVDSGGEMADVFTTGVGIMKHKEELSRLLNARFNNLNEADIFMKALKLILPTLSRDQLFYPLSRKEFFKGHNIAKGLDRMNSQFRKQKLVETSFGPMKDSSQNVTLDTEQVYEHYDNGDILPAIIVMCSSAFAVYKYVDHTSRAESLVFSPRGDKALEGLGSLLTGAKSFDELMELAAQGSSSSVDTYVQDLKGGGKDDFYGLFPDDVYCFSFGKACGKDRDHITFNQVVQINHVLKLRGSGSVTDEFSRADLAASVVMYACNDLCQLAMNHAVSHKVKNVILCGTMISNKVIQETVTLFFTGMSLRLPPEITPKLRMCTMGPYLGVIGAWVVGAEKTSNPDSTQKACSQ